VGIARRGEPGRPRPGMVHRRNESPPVSSALLARVRWARGESPRRTARRYRNSPSGPSAGTLRSFRPLVKPVSPPFDD
jgi:hypothetical protein